MFEYRSIGLLVGNEERGAVEKVFALQEERIKLEKDKFEFIWDLEEERIMKVDIIIMSPKQCLIL